MKRIHDADAWTTTAIAALAFGLSYTKLVDLAVRAGYDPYAAHVWPLIVDGLTIVATRAVLRLTADRKYAWTLLGAGTSVSMIAAVANHLLPPGPLPPIAAAAVSVVPPLCLLVAPHLAVQLSQDARARAFDTAATDQVTPAVDPAATRTEPASPPADPEVAVEAVELREDRRVHALRLLDTTTMSIRAVAREVGVADTTVRRWVKSASAQEVTQSEAEGMIRA